MYPDPNQPQPQPEPIAPVPTPYTTTPVIDQTPAATPNPFGGPVVSSDPVTAAPFAQPVAPIGSAPIGSPVQAPLGKGKTKKLIILISIIVGAVVVLGVIAIVVLSMLMVSKKDYRDAATQYNAVASASSDFRSDASSLQYSASSSTTDTVLANNIDSIKASVIKLQDQNKKLSELKAVRIGEGKRLYDTFNTKLTAYTAYADNLATSLQSVHPALKACSDSTLKGVALLNSCVDAINKVGTMPDADVKAYVTVLQTQYVALQGVTTQLTALTDPYGKQYEQYKSLRDQGYAIQDKMTAASKDLSSNAAKHAKEVDPADQANALGDFLVKKANG